MQEISSAGVEKRQESASAGPPQQATIPGRRLRRSALVTVAIVSVGLLLGACGGGGSSSHNAAASASTTAAAPATTTSGVAATTTAAPAPAPVQGGGGSSAAASAQSVKFASCVRSHGVPNFPDNAVTVTGSGGVLFHLPSGIDANSPEVQSAMKACQSLLPLAAGGGGASTKSTDKLLKYVQCMRTHGVPNFPSPSSNGSIEITGGTGNGALNPSSPQFQQASQACRSLQPAGFGG